MHIGNRSCAGAMFRPTFNEGGNMRVFCFIALFLSVCVGCGGDAARAPDNSELQNFINDNPDLKGVTSAELNDSGE